MVLNGPVNCHQGKGGEDVNVILCEVGCWMTGRWRARKQVGLMKEREKMLIKRQSRKLSERGEVSGTVEL